MSYIGNQPTSVAFLTDQFSGTGSQTAFTLSASPANTASILVAVSGVLQDPTTYSTSGLTLTFSGAPPSGTGNISVRYLGIPASNIATTAYRTQTEFTATAGQTTFSVPSYTVGFIDVYRNGALLGSADFTATNGTTVTLAAGASAGDLIETVSFFVSSVINAIPATAGAVNSTYLLDGSVTAAKMGANGTWAPTGSVIQVVNGSTSTQVEGSYSTATDLGLSASITPKFSTSKILVLVSANGLGTRNNATYWDGYLIRGSTNIGAFCNYMTSYTGGQNTFSAGSLCVLDSPATTSSTTYKLQGIRRTGSDNCIFNITTGNAGVGTISTITLLEIAQ